MKTIFTNLRRALFWVLFSSIASLNISIWAQLAPNSNWTKVISEPFADNVYPWADYNPEIQVVGDTIHFLWMSVRSGRGIVYYRNSTDRGKTLNPAHAIIDTTGNVNTFSGMTDFNLRRMAVSGNKVHIAFLIRSNVFYSVSSNNGLTFSKPRVLCTTQNTSNRSLGDPYISVLGNRVVIGFTQNWVSSYMGAHEANDILAVVSNDGGKSFETVALTPKFDYAYLVDVVQSGKNIHGLILNDDKVQKLGIATSTDNGLNFSLKWISDTLITMDNNLECWYTKGFLPKIATSGDSIYVVWRALDRDTVPKVFFCRSVNNGKSFEAPIILVDSTAKNYDYIVGNSLTVAAKGKNVYVSYTDEDDYAYLLKSNNGGVTFSKPIYMFGEGRVFQYYQNGTLNPKIQFAPSDPTGNDVYYAMNNPKFRHSKDGFNNIGQIKIVDLYATGGYRERTQLAIDQKDVAHFVYEYTLGTGSGEPGYIYYRAYSPNVPKPSTTNMSLSLHCVDSIGRYDNMQIPSSPELCFDDAMSVELWFKPDVGNDGDQNLVLKQCFSNTGNGNFYDGYGLYTDNKDPYAMIYTTVDTYKCYNSKTHIVEGVWNHLAMTYNSKTTGYNFKLYLNGELIDSTEATGNISPYQFESPVWIGGIARTQFAPFDGEMDELRFWNRALTKTEIVANMNKELVGNENGLVAYYNFNGTTKDLTGKGNDGILMYKEAYVPRNSVDINQIEYDQSNSKLAQNFPNPFNQSTVIKYTLASDSKVKIRVYNSMGQEIKVLKDEVNSVGNHEVIFKAFKLPNGIYFYDIQANELCSNKIFRESKKMILKK
jgi:hypothetical protein